jgi:hypothetical protein
MGNQEREKRRYNEERRIEEMERQSFEKRMEELKYEEAKLDAEFRASLINEDAYKIKKNDILKRAHKLRMENNIFIPEEIDEEIKFWESIKSCNYSQKSILFDKIINADDILIQLYKAKQDKKKVKLKTFDFSILYKTEEERRKEGINLRFSALSRMFIQEIVKLKNEKILLEEGKKKLEEEKRKLEEEKYKNI